MSSIATGVRWMGGTCKIQEGAHAHGMQQQPLSQQEHDLTTCPLRNLLLGNVKHTACRTHVWTRPTLKVGGERRKR
eukprot:1152525-Pelagomonas_calceolata.AAC.3